MPALPSGKLPKGTLIPPKDYLSTQDLTFMLHDQKMLYSSNGTVWSFQTNAPVHKKDILSCIGTDCKALFPDGDNGSPCPVGEVLGRSGSELLTAQASCLPLILAYRPFALLRQRGTIVQGAVLAECRAVPTPKGDVTIAFPAAAAGCITYVTVDPARESVPVSYVEEFGGNVHMVLSIEFRQDETEGWIPKGWTARTLSPAGRLMNASRGEVSHCSINQPIPEKDFEIVFPSGTWVIEQTETKGVSKTYLVLENGAKRYLSDAEANMANYENLMHPSKLPSVRWLVASGTLLGLLVLLFVLARRVRRKYT
jgi:hypothetical protein